MRNYLLMAIMAALFSQGAMADDNPSSVCKNAAQLFADDDLEGALEEARWCVTLLEQKQQSLITRHFRDEIMGYKGDKIQQQNAMGFMMISREYENDGNYINVTMNAGNAGSPMQAFSALAQLGLQTNVGQKLRIQKRTAMATSEGGNAKVTVTLRSGGMLVFESDTVPLETLTAFAKAFPIQELDNAKT